MMDLEKKAGKVQSTGRRVAVPWKMGDLTPERRAMLIQDAESRMPAPLVPPVPTGQARQELLLETRPEVIAEHEFFDFNFAETPQGDELVRDKYPERFSYHYWSPIEDFEKLRIEYRPQSDFSLYFKRGTMLVTCQKKNEISEETEKIFFLLPMPEFGILDYLSQSGEDEKKLPHEGDLLPILSAVPHKPYNFLKMAADSHREMMSSTGMRFVAPPKCFNCYFAVRFWTKNTHMRPYEFAVLAAQKRADPNFMMTAGQGCTCVQNLMRQTFDITHLLIKGILIS